VPQVNSESKVQGYALTPLKIKHKLKNGSKAVLYYINKKTAFTL